jgi:hypothetical protein
MTQVSSFEFAVQALVDVGFKRADAEAQVRKQLPHLTPPAPVEVTRDERVLEKAEQVEIRKLFIAHGFTIYNLSQARASKQTPGLPDLYAFHTREPFSTWWETKRQVGGALSPAQREFQEHCQRTRTTYGCGDRWAAAEFLVQHHFAARGPGPYGIIPVRDTLPRN